MAPTAPNPAEQCLARVLTLARWNGGSIVVIAGLGSLLSLLFGDLVGAVVGALAAVAGAMEWHGYRRLRRRDLAGLDWLIRAETCLLAVISLYAISRLGSFDPETVRANLSPEMETALNEAGLATSEVVPLVRWMFLLLYGTVLGVTCIYQGGLVFYYRSRRARLQTAFAPPAAARSPSTPAPPAP